jgi:hypothetical protein
MNAFERHGITHLSPSSVNLWIAQPALWCAAYLMKRRTPVGPAAHRGTAIEAGVEAGLFDPEMPIEECQKIGEAKFHTLTRLSGDPRVEKERATVAPSIAVALGELRQYGIPESAGDDRQHKIVREIDGVGVPVWGFIDFWWPQHGIIVDLKTTSRIPANISDPHARQGAFYAGTGGNSEVRFGYVSEKKIAVYVLKDIAAHMAAFVQGAQSIENFLSLSDDGAKLTRCLSPDLTSFYWSDASARALAHEIWGTAPNSEPPASSAA